MSWKDYMKKIHPSKVGSQYNQTNKRGWNISDVIAKKKNHVIFQLTTGIQSKQDEILSWLAGIM